MAYAERKYGKKGAYWIGRYSDGRGKWPSVEDGHGGTAHFKTKRAAEKAAEDAEADVRGGRWFDPDKGGETFGQLANRRYAQLDLARSTMQNYRRHLEEHLLPAFEHVTLTELHHSPHLVDEWEKAERAAGYKPSSIKTWRATLHVFLGDAVEAGLIPSNPATKRRGRGKRAGKKADRGPERVTTGDLGALLIAERASVLTGRDDELVLVLLDYYTGMRWAELIGLEVRYARLGSARVEAALWEDDSGQFHLQPPKDDSYRTVDTPGWLSKLVSDHVARSAPTPCACHGKRFVFRGLDSSSGRGGAVTLADVAKRAGVSIGTASNVLNHPARVAERTRERVEAAVAELGFSSSRSGAAAGSPHHRRSGFGTWIFGPAASGWYPRKAPQLARPVPLLAEPFPGRPVRGRNSAGRAEMSWAPIAAGLTPHGLRHSHRTALVEAGIRPVLIDERMGHLDGSVQARYTHVTQAMRDDLLEELTARWEAALDARLALSPGSPVAALDALLRAHALKREVGRSEDRPTEFPQEAVSVLRAKPRKGA